MSNLPSRLLYREHYVAAVRPEHPLAKSRTISLDTFCSYDHVLVSPTGGSFEGPTDDAPGRGLPVRLEPRDRAAQPQAGHSQGRACPALSQPDAVCAGLSARVAGDGVRRACPRL